MLGPVQGGHRTGGGTRPAPGRESLRAYRGRMTSRTSDTMSGSVKPSASRNARAAGASATARRTVGNPVPAGPGS